MISDRWGMLVGFYDASMRVRSAVTALALLYFLRL